MVFRLFKQDPWEVPARALYDAIVAQARRPEFYQSLGVPDTLDGRFELIALHSFLVLRRLKGGDAAQAGLSQCLVDLLFHDMDVSLREMGAGDLGVGRRVKAMAQGFYGRAAAYEEGLDQDPGVLESALGRNLYGTVGASEARLAIMADYLRDQVATLAGQDEQALLAGRLVFTAPPIAEAKDV